VVEIYVLAIHLSIVAILASKGLLCQSRSHQNLSDCFSLMLNDPKLFNVKDLIDYKS